MGTNGISASKLTGYFNTGINSNPGIDNKPGVSGSSNDNIIENPPVDEKGIQRLREQGFFQEEVDGTAEENPVFPQTDEPANVSERGGVTNLKDVVGVGSKAVPGDKGQIGSADEKGDLYDMQTTAGLHNVVRKSLEGVKDLFLKTVNADEKIAALENDIKGLADGSEQKNKLESGLKELRALKEELGKAAEGLTKLLSYDESRVSLGIADTLKETDAQREARLKTEINNMKVSLRNFRSDFDRKINRQGWFTRTGHFLRNLLTTTRNSLFGKIFGHGQKQQYIHDYQLIRFEAAKDAFTRKFDSLAAQISLDWRTNNKFEEGTLDQIGSYMDSVAEMIEAKTEDTFANMCVKSVKDQLRNIAENGGYKLMMLEVGVGFGVHFTDNAEASVGVKGKYLYKVFSTGDGSVTIEHVGQGGADVRGKVRVGDILQVNAQGEAIIGGGKSFQYRDLDSAVRSMITRAGKESKLAKALGTRFNPLFIKGRGIGGNIKFGLKYVFVGLPWLVGMGVGKGMDKLHELRTGRHLFDTFDPAKQFRDRKYFDSLKDRGVFKQADKLLTPRKNVLLAGKRSFLRGGAGLGAAIKGRLGPSHLRLDNSLDAQEEFRAKKTDYRTYMTYLTNEQSGQCKDRVLSLMKQREPIFPLEKRTGGNLPPDDVRMVGGNSLEDDILEVLQAKADEVKGGKMSVAERIVGLLQKVIEAEDAYGSAFEELPDETKEQKYWSAARDYRKGMLTTAALFEKFDELDVEDGKLKDSYEDLRETAMSHFENPVVQFPEEVFRERFFTQHTTEDGKIVIKHEHFFEYDALGDLKSKMLGDTALSDSLGAGEGGFGGMLENAAPGKLLGRAGAIGAVEGGSKALGLEGSVGVTVTEEVPTATDKKAEWLSKPRKTYDFQFSANATFDTVMRGMLNAYCKAEGIPLPEYGERTETGGNQAISALASALKRAFFDLKAKFDGVDPNSSIAKSDKHFVNGGNAPEGMQVGLDFWRTGRTIRLEFFDGRLSSISFGDGEKLSFKLGVPLGPVVFHGEYKFEALENKHSFWTAPSYDALLEKCDAYMTKGNRTMWKMFTQRNQAGLARMADVYVKQMSGESIGKGNALEKDSDAKDDIARIKHTRDRIGKFFEDPGFNKLPESLRRRLEENREKLQKAESMLAMVCELDDGLFRQMADLPKKEREAIEAQRRNLWQPKMEAMRSVLMFSVRHFDIMQARDADLKKEFRAYKGDAVQI